METKKIRVVGYARVSTKKNEQKNSLENQRAHFQRVLSEKEGYTLVSLPTNDHGIYADPGFSGTKLSRPAFDKMLYDAGLRRIVDNKTGKPAPEYSFRVEAEPKFDQIYVKDASRFARDTKVIAILHMLLTNGVTVYFEDIGKSTDVSSDWTYIQIFFNFAESESRQRSEKVKRGYEEGVRKGRIYAGSVPLGYDYIPLNEENPLEGNRLVANDKAIIVKTIFDLYEQGLGSKHIEQRLEHLGYTTANGGRIDRSVIRYILQNEKYAGENNAGKFTHGDLFNKKLTPVPYDAETRVAGRKASARIAKKLAKMGKVQIEPIISREQFDRVQKRFNEQSEKFRNKERFNSNNPYANKLRCAICGAPVLVSYSVPKTDKNGKPLKDENDEIIRNRRYKCSNAFQYGKGKCPATSFSQKVIDNFLDSNAYYEQEYEMLCDVSDACERCLVVLGEAFNRDNTKIIKALDAKINQLTNARTRLYSLYAEEAISDKDGVMQVYNDYTKQITELTDRRYTLSKPNEDIEKDIALVMEMKVDADEKEDRIMRILKSKNYDVTDRNEKIRNIDYISVDTINKTDPIIAFRTRTELQGVIDRVEEISHHYNTEL